MIIEHVWNLTFDTTTNVVDVYINYLRRKIDDGHTAKLIHTIRGVGYEVSDPGESRASEIHVPEIRASEIHTSEIRPEGHSSGIAPAKSPAPGIGIETKG
jgi:DNA-binding winged helix-turn-helix (wHTH) protein